MGYIGIKVLDTQRHKSTFQFLLRGWNVIKTVGCGAVDYRLVRSIQSSN